MNHLFVRFVLVELEACLSVMAVVFGRADTSWMDCNWDDTHAT